MASEPRNYPDYVFVAYDEDFSAQTYNIAVSLEPGNLVGRPVKYIRHDLNTRPAPAATDTGLETVAWESMDNKLDPNDKLVYEVKFPRNGDKRLVYKSQAEELLAAERAEKEELKKALADRAWISNKHNEHRAKLKADNEAKDAENSYLKELVAARGETIKRGDDRIRKLEADNAAKDALIKELEAALDSDPSGSGLWRYWSRKACEVTQKYVDEVDRAEALEAKLAAAEKALEFYADASKWDDGYFKSEDDGTVLRAYPSSVDKDQGDKARAALGGKPS
ncbi:hypothetical protein NJB93_07420 [Brucella intermedia]|uniref:hypothetical protein n=1 Tax=Brucella intermedia TaxID=94625 RepID=UPI002096F6EF|nr:hypothetical protein [Brucella intermedia]MCO7726422.1 hypothetical protein [Brucella intermedia]